MTQPIEEVKLAIFNKNNILIDKKNIQQILAKADIKNKASDLTIWQQAFVHSSYSKNVKKNRKYNGYVSKDGINNCNTEEDNPDDCIPIQNKSSEVLEFLGDSMLQSIVTDYLSKRFPKSDEGFLTKLRSKLVKTESLSKFSKFYSLGKYLIISKHIEVNCNGRENSHILEDAFEALIGAMYLDFSSKGIEKGYGICHKFVIYTIEQTVDFTDLIMNDDNYKDQLMRYFQKQFKGAFPIYEEELHDEEDKTFYIIIKHPLNSKIIARGKGANKKKAEQMAAKQGLNYFGIERF